LFFANKLIAVRDAASDYFSIKLTMKFLKASIVTSLVAGGLLAGLMIASAQEAPHHSTNALHKANSATAAPAHHVTNSVHHVASPSTTAKHHPAAAVASPHHPGTNQPSAQPHHTPAAPSK